MQGYDWGDLRFLLAAVRGGSFAAAARRLGVDQATVGRRLRALQEAAGTPLWERSPGRLALTGAGRRALRAAEVMDAAALELERSVDAGLPLVEGTLRINATEALAARILAPRLPQLLARHPALTVELASSNEVANLARREGDLSVRLARPTEPALVARKAGVIAFGLYASRSYLHRAPVDRESLGLPSRSGGGQSPPPRESLGLHPRSVGGQSPPPPGERALRGHALLGYDRALAARSEALAWPDALEGRVVLRASSSAAVLAAAEAGLGIGAVPCFLADGVKELVRVVPALRMRELWIAVHGDLRASARARAGMEFLREALREAGRALRGEAEEA